jgi:hypothetical protein
VSGSLYTTAWPKTRSKHQQPLGGATSSSDCGIRQRRVNNLPDYTVSHKTTICSDYPLRKPIKPNRPTKGTITRNNEVTSTYSLLLFLVYLLSSYHLFLLPFTLHLYSQPSIIRMIKSRRMRWAGHVARMGRRETNA